MAGGFLTSEPPGKPFLDQCRNKSFALFEKIYVFCNKK